MVRARTTASRLERAHASGRPPWRAPERLATAVTGPAAHGRRQVADRTSLRHGEQRLRPGSGQALALQPFGGDLVRVLPIAVDLGVRARSAPRWSARADTASMAAVAVALPARPRAQQRDDVLRQDHRLGIRQLHVAVVRDHALGGEERRHLDLVVVQVLDLRRVLRVRLERLELGAVDLLQPLGPYARVSQLGRSAQGRVGRRPSSGRPAR